MKFCITLIGGYLIFNDAMKLHQLLGVSLTFLGIIVYTYFKLEEQKSEKRIINKV